MKTMKIWSKDQKTHNSVMEFCWNSLPNYFQERRLIHTEPRKKLITSAQLYFITKSHNFLEEILK